MGEGSCLPKMYFKEEVPGFIKCLEVEDKNKEQLESAASTFLPNQSLRCLIALLGLTAENLLLLSP